MFPVGRFDPSIEEQKSRLPRGSTKASGATKEKGRGKKHGDREADRTTPERNHQAGEQDHGRHRNQDGGELEEGCHHAAHASEIHVVRPDDEGQNRDR